MTQLTTRSAAAKTLTFSNIDSKANQILSEMAWFFGESETMQKLRRDVVACAQKRSPVVLSGENGVGKAVLARLIHTISSTGGRFVTFDAASVAPSQLEVELAHAMQNTARDGQAGTLHLIGIEYLPSVLQQRLMQHYRTSCAEASPIAPPARLLCSARQSLSELVAGGLFPEKLYQDSDTMALDVPTLDAHSEDIPMIADHIVKQYSGSRQVRLSKEAYAVLKSHKWGGNLRELAGVIRSAVLTSPRHILGAEDFTPLLNKTSGSMTEPSSVSLPEAAETCLTRYFDGLRGMAPAPELYARVMSEVEKPLIENVLRYVRGNQLRAAEVLGINRNTLRKKIRELGIDAKKTGRS